MRVKTHVSRGSRVCADSRLLQSNVPNGFGAGRDAIHDFSMWESPRSRAASPALHPKENFMKHATRLLTALVAVAAMASFAAAGPTTWKIDPVHTSVGFDVRHIFARVHGVFHDTDGTIMFDE